MDDRYALTLRPYGDAEDVDHDRRGGLVVWILVGILVEVLGLVAVLAQLL